MFLDELDLQLNKTEVVYLTKKNNYYHMSGKYWFELKFLFCITEYINTMNVAFNKKLKHTYFVGIIKKKILILLGFVFLISIFPWQHHAKYNLSETVHLPHFIKKVSADLKKTVAFQPHQENTQSKNKTKNTTQENCEHRSHDCCTHFIFTKNEYLFVSCKYIGKDVYIEKTRIVIDFMSRIFKPPIA